MVTLFRLCRTGPHKRVAASEGSRTAIVTLEDPCTWEQAEQAALRKIGEG